LGGRLATLRPDSPAEREGFELSVPVTGADGGNSCVGCFIRCRRFVVGKVSPQRGFKNPAFLRRRPTAEMTSIMRSVLSVSSAPLLPDGYVDDTEIAYLVAVSGKVLPE
jgi:hypothetical protein